jgi:hypothetical protein
MIMQGIFNTLSPNPLSDPHPHTHISETICSSGRIFKNKLHGNITIIYYDNVSHDYRPIVALVSQGKCQKWPVFRQEYIVKQIILKKNGFDDFCIVYRNGEA